MTKNNKGVLFEAAYWNGYNLNPLTRIYERASLVPAAAVIPALKVYIVIAAVKKLVVGSLLFGVVGTLCSYYVDGLQLSLRCQVGIQLLPGAYDTFTLKKLECLTQAQA